MLLRRDRHVRRRGKEEKSERFGNVSETLRDQVGLSQQPHSGFSFCRLETKCSESHSDLLVPLFLFILSNVSLSPPCFQRSPRGCFIQRVLHVTFYLFFDSQPQSHFKVKRNILSQMGVIPGPSDRCPWVEVGPIGLCLQESEVIWETVKQLFISLGTWGRCAHRGGEPFSGSPA